MEWNRDDRGKADETYVSRQIKDIVRSALPNHMASREYAAANRLLERALFFLQRDFNPENADQARIPSQRDIFKALWKANRHTENFSGHEPIDEGWIEGLKYQFARFIRNNTYKLNLVSARKQLKRWGRVKTGRPAKTTGPAKSRAPEKKRDPIETAMGSIARSALPKGAQPAIYEDARHILMNALADLQKRFRPKRTNEGETPSITKISGSLWKAYDRYYSRRGTEIDSQMIEQLKLGFALYIRKNASKLKLMGERIQREQ